MLLAEFHKMLWDLNLVKFCHFLGLVALDSCIVFCCSFARLHMLSANPKANPDQIRVSFCLLCLVV